MPVNGIPTTAAERMAALASTVLGPPSIPEGLLAVARAAAAAREQLEQATALLPTITRLSDDEWRIEGDTDQLLERLPGLRALLEETAARSAQPLAAFAARDDREPGRTSVVVPYQLEPDPEFQRQQVPWLRRLYGLPPDLDENEQLIADTRAEFPYDPLGYGAVYPGDNGESRWTPPPDGQEVPSCPA